MSVSETSLFPALLRYWRGVRGLSQLDLAGASDVSPKHVSFLETGRSRPSREMVLKLGSTLDVPLRDQNALLSAAGFAEVFSDPERSEYDPAVRRALDVMMAHHEPYPLMVFDGGYDIVAVNKATRRMLRTLMGPDAQVGGNVLAMLFDPEGIRRFVVDWERIARDLLIRLQREVLYRRRDDRLRELLSRLCATPGVPEEWRSPDLETQSEAVMSVQFDFGGQRLGFLTTITVFQAPQNVALEELRIESYYPLDDLTDAVCRQLAAAEE